LFIDMWQQTIRESGSSPTRFCKKGLCKFMSFHEWQDARAKCKQNCLASSLTGEPAEQIDTPHNKRD